MHITLEVGLALVAIALTALAVVTLYWMLHAWRTPDALVDTQFERRPDEPALSFSLLVPARHEQAVLAATLDRLCQLAHPDFEVIAIVGDDDPETAAVARAAAGRAPGTIRVVVDEGVPKNKPRALNRALESAAARWWAPSTPRTTSTSGCCASSTRRFASTTRTSCKGACS